MLRNLRIGTKMIGTLLLLAALIAMAFLVGTLSMRTVEQSVDTIYEDHFSGREPRPGADAHPQCARRRLEIHGRPRPAGRDRARRPGRLRRGGAGDGALPGTTRAVGEEKNLLDDFDTRFRRYRTLCVTALAHINADRMAEVQRSIQDGELAAARGDLDDTLGKLKEVNTKRATTRGTPRRRPRGARGRSR